MAYRIAQEALYNALRHGVPREVTVRLAPGVLEVRDDGIGFDVGAGAREGLGLASMRDRAIGIQVTPAVGERVRGDVEDAHDQRALAELKRRTPRQRDGVAAAHDNWRIGGLVN